MLSLAFGELLFYVVFSWHSFTKGNDGIQCLLPPLYFQDPVNYYYLTLAIVIAALLAMWRITESPFGYIMRTLRDNQRRALRRNGPWSGSTNCFRYCNRSMRVSSAIFRAANSKC